MKKTVLIAVIVSVFFGASYWLWHKGQLPFFGNNNLVDSSRNAPAGVAANTPIWLFTFADCGNSCINAVKELHSRKVPFVEKVINPERRDEPDFALWQSYATDHAFPMLVIGKQTLTGFFVPDIATLLANSFGETYLTPAEKSYFKPHFNADGSPRIVLYGTDWCSFCAALRKEFNAHQVSFTDVDAERVADPLQLHQTMGISIYPAVWVGYTRVKSGANYQAIMALADQASENNL